MKIVEAREYYGLHRGDKESMPAKIIADKYQVDYVVLAPDLPAKEDRATGTVKGRRLKGEKALEEVAGGSKYYRVRLLPAFEWRTSWMPTIFFEIIKERPDLLVCSPGYTFSLKDYAIMAAKKLLNVPLVFLDAGDEIFAQTFFKRILSPVERIWVRKCVDLVITYSELGQEHLRRVYGLPLQAIKVIPKGINLNRFSPSLDGRPFLKEHGIPAGFTALYVSRLDKPKGPHVFLEVAKKCRELGLPELNFVLVGDGEMRAELEEYCRENSLDNVYFTGMLPNRKIAAAYAAADVFVMPYTKDLFAAGFGTVVAEAMAMGKPIIIGLKGYEKSTPLKHMENAILTSPGNAEEIAEAIASLYHDGKLRERLGQSARAYAQKQMDWQAQADVYYELYRQLIAAKRGNRKGGG